MSGDDGGTIYSAGDTLGYLEEDICRICYSGRSRENLMTPCRCSGTLGFVHRSCLNTWIENSGTPRCEICRACYPLTVDYKWWKVWNDIWFKYFVRQEPLFIFASALINTAASIVIKPHVITSQVWEELMIFSALIIFTMAIAFSVALTRNLTRYILWRWEASDGNADPSYVSLTRDLLDEVD